jgi:hypothetical protein
MPSTYATDPPAAAEQPNTNCVTPKEDWESEFPFVKFATDGRRVKFGMRFGAEWYVVKECPVGPDGKFAQEQLTEICRYVG